MIDAHHPLLSTDAPYRLEDASNVLTPALAIYPEIVDANIAATLAPGKRRSQSLASARQDGQACLYPAADGRGGRHGLQVRHHA